MSALSNYLEGKLCDWLRGTAMPTAPAALYVSLHAGDPGETGASNDVTTTIRAAGRVAVTFAAHTDGVMLNNAIVDFGDADADVDDVSHFAVWDASSAGNCLFKGALSQTMDITQYTLVSFPVSSLQFSAA